MKSAALPFFSAQVANISYRKKEVIDTIRKLAQSGQFAAWANQFGQRGAM